MWTHRLIAGSRPAPLSPARGGYLLLSPTHRIGAGLPGNRRVIPTPCPGPSGDSLRKGAPGRVPLREWQPRPGRASRASRPSREIARKRKWKEEKRRKGGIRHGSFAGGDIFGLTKGLSVTYAGQMARSRPPSRPATGRGRAVVRTTRFGQARPAAGMGRPRFPIANSRPRHCTIA